MFIMQMVFSGRDSPTKVQSNPFSIVGNPRINVQESRFEKHCKVTLTYMVVIFSQDGHIFCLDRFTQILCNISSYIIAVG